MKQSKQFILFWIGILAWLSIGMSGFLMSFVGGIAFLVFDTAKYATIACIGGLILCAFVVVSGIIWATSNSQDGQYEMPPRLSSDEN